MGQDCTNRHRPVINFIIAAGDTNTDYSVISGKATNYYESDFVVRQCSCSPELWPHAKDLYSPTRSSCLMKEDRQSEALIWGWAGLAGPCRQSWTVWLRLTHISAVCVCVSVKYLWTGRHQDCIGSTWRQTPPSYDRSSGLRQEVWSSTEIACKSRKRGQHEILMQMYIAVYGYSIEISKPFYMPTWNK